MSFLYFLFCVWLGGALHCFLLMWACRSWQRLSTYDVVFMIVYWLPLSIEMIGHLDRKTKK